MSLQSSDEDEAEMTPEDMPMDIQIKLDRQVFFVGQDVTGTVEISNKHNRNMRGIRLTLTCKGDLFWWETKRKTRTKTSNDKIFLQFEQYIAGDGKKTTLEAGEQSFPFTVSLASKNDLPSSMEFPNGHVRYLLKAEVDWPWASVQGHERLLNVVNVCNLCDHSDSLQPATFTANKVTILTGMANKVTISGRLEKIAYVPGEEILLHAEISNNSRSVLPGCFIQLAQIVDYFSSNGKQMTTRNVLVTNEYGEIGPKRDMILEMESIVVPAVPQSRRVTWEFLRVNYEVSINVLLGGKIRTAKNAIFIGTLPTKNTYRRFDPGFSPSSHICEWPFKTIVNLPFAKLELMPNNPDIDYEKLATIDPDFKLHYPAFTFDKERAIQLIEENAESSADEFEHDAGGHAMSDFSL